MIKKNTKVIALIAIVLGATGVTIGYFMLTKPDSKESLLLLLPLPPIQAEKNWTWVSGNSEINQLGIYGKKGVADSNNVPGARRGATSWIDSEDNLWIFGGDGYDNITAASTGFLNDLWKFNTTSSEWTWVSGNYSRNNLGNYGVKGVANANNVPGARYAGISWTGSDGLLWLFGGQGYDNVTGGFGTYLNDLWKFNTTSSEWTWVSGNYSGNKLGNYGVKGVANANNIPGARYAGLSWKDSADYFWLFGGMGFDNVTGGIGYCLNDLWKFDGVNWTWVSGNYSVNNLGNYGVKGVANANNVPGGRYLSGSWIDSKNNLWLFGGEGYNNVTGPNFLNDLWKYDGANWIWVSGNYTLNQNATFGIKGVADANNVPGAMRQVGTSKDSDGNFWLFAGRGYNNQTGYGFGSLNTLWKYKNGLWTWVSGNYSLDNYGIYGTKGVANETNIPGARNYHNCWMDSRDNLWIFGGYGRANTTYGSLNCLWKYGS